MQRFPDGLSFSRSSTAASGMHSSAADSAKPAVTRERAEVPEGLVPEMPDWRARWQPWRASPLAGLGGATPFIWGWPAPGPASYVVGPPEAGRCPPPQGQGTPVKHHPSAGSARHHSNHTDEHSLHDGCLDLFLLRFLWALGDQPVPRRGLERRLNCWLRKVDGFQSNQTGVQLDVRLGPPRTCSSALAIEALAWCHAFSRVAAACDVRLHARLADRLRDWAASSERLGRSTARETDREGSHDPLAWQLWSAELPLAVQYVMVGVDGGAEAESAIASLRCGLEQLADPPAEGVLCWLRLLPALVACWTRCVVVANAAQVELGSHVRDAYAQSVVRLLQWTRTSGETMFSLQRGAASAEWLERAATVAGSEALRAWKAWRAPRGGAVRERSRQRAAPSAIAGPGSTGERGAAITTLAQATASGGEKPPDKADRSAVVPLPGVLPAAVVPTPPLAALPGVVPPIPVSPSPSLVATPVDASAGHQLRAPELAAGGAAGLQSPSAVPEPSYCREEPCLALMRQAGGDAPRCALVCEGESLHIELEAAGRVWLHGPWQTRIWLNGEQVPPPRAWQQTGWEVTDDALYLELEGAAASELLVQRYMVLSRRDKFVLMADALLGTDAGDICCEMCIPLSRWVAWLPAPETREGMMVAGRSRLRILPLALPEWRCDPRPGSLAVKGTSLVLQQQARRARRMLVPLWIDLAPHRWRQSCTWRQLTVGEDLAVVPPDVACAYRVQVGREQWLTYRTLGPAASRTMLGHHLVTEMLVARFTRRGLVEAILEIE